MAASAAHLPKLKGLLAGTKSALLADIYSRIDTIDDIKTLIDSSIKEEPPATLKDGGVINSGYNAELDELRDLASNIKEKITSIEASEKERTGIPKLKIGYNHVFGYYIEVSKSYQSLVPPEYIRKQTLANGERYITQELKELEDMVKEINIQEVEPEDKLSDDIYYYDKYTGSFTKAKGHLK